jgi:peptidoglycan/xylan/chitin deacetylase (PgdA/CDA1 family)
MKLNKAGIVISLDDAYLHEWFEADKVLSKYDWKATFCVCRIDSIGKQQLQKLHQLQDEGYEIASHGYHRYNAVTFVKANGIDQYIKQEIDPMIASMKRLNFNITSFAYPYGERSSELGSVGFNNK